MKEKLEEIRLRHNLKEKKQQFFNSSKHGQIQKNSDRFLKHLVDLLFLVYCVKYALKYMRYKDFISNYNAKTTIFNYIGNALKFLAPGYSKIIDNTSEFLSFLKGMALESISIISNSTSTYQILNDSFSLSAKPIDLCKIFMNTFKIQMSNPYNIYIAVAIFCLHILIFHKCIFSRKIFIIIFCDLFGFIMRVTFISVGGLLGVNLKFSGFYVIIGLASGCFFGCLVSIYIHHTILNKIVEDFNERDFKNHYLKEAINMLNVKENCQENELEVQTFRHLQMNNERNKLNLLMHNNIEANILVSYEIVLEDIEAKKKKFY